MKLRPLLLGFLFLLPSAKATKIDPEKELLIRDLSVVQNERAQGEGPFSFGGLLRRLAPKDPGEFAFRWFNLFTSTTSLNGFPISPRFIGDLKALWPLPNPEIESLDTRRSPFLLLAVVPRFDLRKADRPAGEARLVFAPVHPSSGEAVPFTVIFEFILPTSENRDLQYWARRFHALGALPFGEKYNSALATLVQDFSTQLGQIRTNDFYLDSEWEMREFSLVNGEVKANTTAQTPDPVFEERQAPELIRWIEENRDAVLKENYELPTRFLGGASPTPDEGFGWYKKTTLDKRLRQAFSKNTCNGCHSGDTSTRFNHIFARPRDQVSEISPFLRGELELRKSDLQRILEHSPEAGEPPAPPISANRVH